MIGDPEIEVTAAKLRHELADHLAAEGWLRSPDWRAAVEAVPRHAFAPRFYRASDAPGSSSWLPVTRELVGVDEWLRLVYADESLITQFDGHEPDWTDPQPMSDANPTSSSTLPSLVVRMLEELQVDDGQNALEIGTGTGYPTALMCHQLGAAHVTSIETDHGVAARARDALSACGYLPRLLTRDGLAGDPGGAPYDRTIATVGVRSIPKAWVEQTRPGGFIVATVRGWMRSLGLVRLTVGADDNAEGRFLDPGPTFMIARQQSGPTSFGMIPQPDDGEARETSYGPELLTMTDSGFVAQLALPDARCFTMLDENGTTRTYVLDAVTHAFAVLTQNDDGTWVVQQGGTDRLWDHVEEALALWHAADAPPPTEFGLTVRGAVQRVWMGTPDGPSWFLRAEESTPPGTGRPPGTVPR
ncbi:ATP-grasp peptide maturase system methyltransferase [Streptomyces sp. NPDC003036]|uniref:ATP-grasp peptide maturase system methyltransferase n=1 Tax=Streptomyces sp. NPDC003036 TaxID=3154442 RepID=UPI0033B8FE82